MIIGKLCQKVTSSDPNDAIRQNIASITNRTFSSDPFQKQDFRDSGAQLSTLKNTHIYNTQTHITTRVQTHTIQALSTSMFTSKARF